MTQDERFVTKLVVGALIVIVVIVGIIFGSMAIYSNYRVWTAENAGRADYVPTEAGIPILETRRAPSPQKVETP